MHGHFSSFTPEAMRALGKGMAVLHQGRVEFVSRNAKETAEMLGRFRAQRRQSARHDANARRIFVSEAKAGVHALLRRFGLVRREVAADIKAAKDAWRACHGARPAPSARREARAAPSFASGLGGPSLSDYAFRAEESEAPKDREKRRR